MLDNNGLKLTSATWQAGRRSQLNPVLCGPMSSGRQRGPALQRAVLTTVCALHLGCADTTADLAALQPGMTRAEVERRIGPGLSSEAVPKGLASNQGPCGSPQYYKVSYKWGATRALNRLLREPGAHAFWRVCFSEGTVTSSERIALVTY
jgi:hypothetical protein